MATQADIDAILTALTSGTQRVRFANGSEVQYRTVPDMIAALNVLRGEVAGAAPGYDNADRATFATICRD